MSEKSTFYLVREEILPEAIKKTIKVKEILKRGEIKIPKEYNPTELSEEQVNALIATPPTTRKRTTTKK